MNRYTHNINAMTVAEYPAPQTHSPQVAEPRRNTLKLLHIVERLEDETIEALNEEPCNLPKAAKTIAAIAAADKAFREAQNHDFKNFDRTSGEGVYPEGTIILTPEKIAETRQTLLEDLERALAARKPEHDE